MDTNDTATPVEEQPQKPIVSAAELAGEEGGFSCATVQTNTFSIILLLFLIGIIKK